MATKPENAIPMLPSGDGAPHECWSCGDMRAAQFCRSCGSVQPPAPTDYFSFFGLPRLLNIETGKLEKTMLALSRRLHPDLYGRASDQEQEWSLEQTSKLNDAYRTLRDPVQRTEYLLRIEGVRTTERTKEDAPKAAQLRTAPPGLLEEVFELNMLLEEYRGGDHSDELRGQLHQAREHLEEKLQAVRGELKSSWLAWDGMQTSGDEADERRRVLEQMMGIVHRRRYLDHLIHEIATAIAE